MDFDPSTRQLVNKILADFQTTRLDLADEAEVFGLKNVRGIAEIV